MKKETKNIAPVRLMLLKLGFISSYCVVMGTGYIGLKTLRTIVSPPVKFIKNTRKAK